MTSTIKVDTIEEKTSANGVAIDSVTLKDGAVTATAASTITVADNSDTLTLKSTDTDASAGPILKLSRDNNSAAASDVVGKIIFTAEDAGNNLTDYAEFLTQITDASDGSESVRFIIKGMKAGNYRKLIDFNTTETVFNDESDDLDFRVESNGNTHMLFVDAGSDIVGIGADPDLGVGLHIKSADSGASVNANRDELVLENSGHCGMTILSGTSSVGGIGFGDSGGNLQGLMQYNHSTDNFEFNTNSTQTPLVLVSGGQLATNAEVAPDTTAGGLCLNQGANDGPIFTLKSSDIDHGQTDGDETDTFAKFMKNHATVGGLKAQTYSSGESAFIIDGRYSTDNTTKGTGATCPVQVNVRKINGTSVTSPGADANMFSVTNNGQTKFIVDEDGDIHNDGSVTAYDTYEDAQLVRAFDLSHGKGVIDSKFDKFIKYNHEKLADMKLVGREEDGTPNHFINVTGMQRLHNGAIWQQYEKHQKLANAMYELAKAAVGEDKANEILEQNDITLLN